MSLFLGRCAINKRNGNATCHPPRCRTSARHAFPDRKQRGERAVSKTVNTRVLSAAAPSSCGKSAACSGHRFLCFVFFLYFYFFSFTTKLPRISFCNTQRQTCGGAVQYGVFPRGTACSALLTGGFASVRVASAGHVPITFPENQITTLRSANPSTVGRVVVLWNATRLGRVFVCVYKGADVRPTRSVRVDSSYATDRSPFLRYLFLRYVYVSTISYCCTLKRVPTGRYVPTYSIVSYTYTTTANVVGESSAKVAANVVMAMVRGVLEYIITV